MLLPTVTCPNERLAGVAASASPPTPVPTRPTLRFEFDALLVKVTELLVHPFDAGKKFALKAILCPAARSSGSFKPERLNSELLTLDPEIVTAVCPVLVNAMIWVSD
jgi:hypothetical protein